jgi:hypothetical protein
VTRDAWIETRRETYYGIEKKTYLGSDAEVTEPESNGDRLGKMSVEKPEESVVYVGKPPKGQKSGFS